MSMLWRIFKVKSKNTPSPPPAEGNADSDSCESNKGLSDWEGDPPPNLERSRSRGDRMSVSRSGRFKQKSRRRSGLFDNPNLAARNYDENSAPATAVGEKPVSARVADAEARWRNGTAGVRAEITPPIQAAG